MKTTILLAIMLVTISAAVADQSPSKPLNQVPRSTLEQAPTKAASAIMTMIVKNTDRRGRYMHEIQIGFDRQKVAIASIKKVGLSVRLAG
ncbi:MAG: hypothetical protein ACI8T1_001970 [Verrucomicrobiales bacterium]|jgi:hypothetical protein